MKFSIVHSDLIIRNFKYLFALAGALKRDSFFARASKRQLGNKLQVLPTQNNAHISHILALAAPRFGTDTQVFSVIL